jgi:capsular polysaccharide biosynthesis protein
MQDQAPITPAYDLGHYLRPLQRQRRWLVIAVVGGLVLGTAFTLISKPKYTAAARVLVGPTLTVSQAAGVNATGSRTPNLPLNLDTEAQFVKSLPVATLAQQILKTSTSPNALLGRVGVTVPPNTTILRISCQARSAKVAQACANAFANAYLTNRGSTETTTINSQLAAVATQRTAAQALLQKYATAGVRAAKGTPAKILDFAEVTTEQTDLSQLNQERVQLTQLLPANAGTINSPATRGVASKANRVIPPITGLLLGLLVGVAAIFGRERFDRNVRHRDDLLRSGVEVVAEIEAAHGRENATRLRRERVARTRFDQRIASVVAGSFDHDGGVVYVACVSPGQADTDVARHLATTLASVGHHVEIVRPQAIEVVEATDFDSTAQPSIEDDEIKIDVAAALLGWPSPVEAAADSTALVATKAAEVELTPVETLPDSVPLNIRMQLEIARGRAQFVIIDGDPAVSDAQAYILAGLSDASLLVVDPDATTRQDLDEVVEQISVSGSHLLGAVIWRPGRKQHEAEAAAPGGARISSWRRDRAEAQARADHADDYAETTLADVADSDEPASSQPSRPVDAAR